MAKKLEELAYIDKAGFHIADFEDFLEYHRDAMRRIYGSDINLDADSQDCQLVAHIAQSQYDMGVLCAAVFNAYSPSSAVGESLSRQGERQKFCVHGIIGARQTGASNEHEHQTQFS